VINPRVDQEPGYDVCPVTARPTSPTPCQRQRRYPSDTTDPKWALIEPLLPAAAGRRHTPAGRWPAIPYLVHNGCLWRPLPARCPAS
jgi:hypothetical protein